MIQHVLPMGEKHTEITFQAEGDPIGWPYCDCLCEPRREYLSESDSWLFIHNSFDGREGLEWVKEILKPK